MSDAIRQTIEVLQSEIVSQEQDLAANKKLVNSLSRKIGVPEPYPDIADPGASRLSVKADAYYRMPFATAVRNLLSVRHEPLSLGEVVAGLKAGGFDFEDRGEPEASARIALGKNSATFVQIPNSDKYGLREWYNGGKKVQIVKRSKPSGARNSVAGSSVTEDDDEGQIPPEFQDDSSLENETIDEVQP